MIQMLGQVTNLIMPKFIARKPKIKHGTYNKYGFAITLHQYCMSTSDLFCLIRSIMICSTGMRV